MTFAWDNWLPPEIIVIIVGFIPVLELRMAIPLGMALGLNVFEAFSFGVLGNLLQVPLVLLALQWLCRYTQRRLPIVERWLEKTMEVSRKHERLVQRYGFLGLALVVGIPFPGTGIWTGSLLAILFDIRFGVACLGVGIGVLFSGLLVALASYGFFEFVFEYFPWLRW